MGHQWPWYAVTAVGAIRLTADLFDVLVRRVVRTASQARAEIRSARRITAVPEDTHDPRVQPLHPHPAPRSPGSRTRRTPPEDQ